MYPGPAQPTNSNSSGNPPPRPPTYNNDYNQTSSSNGPPTRPPSYAGDKTLQQTMTNYAVGAAQQVYACYTFGLLYHIYSYASCKQLISATHICILMGLCCILQRYTSNPTQFFNDVQSAGENPFMRSVATSAVKSMFKS